MFLRTHPVLCVFALLAFGPAAFAQTPIAELTPVAPMPKPVVALPVTSATTTTQLPPATPPIDAHQRLAWLYVENLGVGSVLDDIAVGAADTVLKTPEEYSTHWSGFGARIGTVTGNYAVKSVMEVGLGSMWGEDPRYFRTTGLSVKGRMAYVIKATFLARNRDGNTMPAYSRFIAFPASSFLMNEWTPKSEATSTDAVVRVGLGFLSRMGENAWKEFIVPRK